jgi:hypothetical protein
VADVVTVVVAVAVTVVETHALQVAGQTSSTITNPTGVSRTLPHLSAKAVHATALSCRL